MFEVLKESFLPWNLPYTLGLLGVLVYWLLVIAGTLDIEIFHFHLESQ